MTDDSENQGDGDNNSGNGQSGGSGEDDNVDNGGGIDFDNPAEIVRREEAPIYEPTPSWDKS